MKRRIFIAIALTIAIGIQAQTIKLVGTWNEEGATRTWIFNANGTKALKGSMNVQLPIAGYSVPCELVQTRTEEKWKLDGNVIQFTAIPLQIVADVKNMNLNGVSEAIRAKIKAGVPKLKQQIVTESKNDWQANMVGKSYSYVVESYSPKQLVLNLDGQRFILNRDVENMTAAQKAEFDKEVAEYEAWIQKEKEMREAAKREAEAKAKREAEERARIAEEARIKADNMYWERLGSEKKSSYNKAAAEGVNLVDLGLSVRWADRNLGASSVSDKGEYYAWGEITPKTDSNSKYKPIVKPKDGAILDVSSDPATVRWGTGWHVPTIEQWKELFEKCSMKENNDHTGVEFTGPNGNTITIPFTNYTYWAHYWANSISYKGHARCASVPRQAPTKKIEGITLKSSDTPETKSMSADTLFPIRAVME